MNHYLLIFCLSSFFFCNSQEIWFSNNSKVCSESINEVYLKTEKKDTFHHKIYFLFSNSTMIISEEKCDSIIADVFNGASLYCGLENDPLQTEGTYILHKMFALCTYASASSCSISQKVEANELSNLKVANDVSYQNTPLYFPMSEMYKIELWQDDQPVLVSAKYGKGKVIFDGAYARFYCENWINDGLIEEIFRYLIER